MSYVPPPPPPDGGPGPVGYAPLGFGPPRTNGKATAALVLGIVSVPFAFCCSAFGLVGVAAIVLGHLARKEVAASAGTQTGEQMARAGFVLGIIGTALAVVTTTFSVVLMLTGERPV